MKYEKKWCWLCKRKTWFVESQSVEGKWICSCCQSTFERRSGKDEDSDK